MIRKFPKNTEKHTFHFKNGDISIIGKPLTKKFRNNLETILIKKQFNTYKGKEL